MAFKSATYRDEIHSDIRTDQMMVALLNTRTMQRLGRVYQLGYAHLVYRGATHTRLSHAMGTAHLADRIVESLQNNYRVVREVQKHEREENVPRGAVPPCEFLPCPAADSVEDRWDFLLHITRWAALLHDVGHIPLGHTLEDEFTGIYDKHDHFGSARNVFLWFKEKTGCDGELKTVLTNNKLYPSSFDNLNLPEDEIAQLVWEAVMLTCLFKEEYDSDGNLIPFRSLIEGALPGDGENPAIATLTPVLNAALKRAEANNKKTYLPYFSDIVGNTICADFLDYLRRDAANVGLDQLRDDRVISRFYIGKSGPPDNSLRMALALTDRRGKPRLDTCTGVVDLVRQRFKFAEIIHYHKTKISASTMFAKAIELLGKPEEVREDQRVEIRLQNVEDLLSRLVEVEDPEREVEILRQASMPAALLDPEMGDETLILFLQNRGWQDICQVISAVDRRSMGERRKAVEKYLRGIALLQGIIRRELYKVCFVVDSGAYGELTPGSETLSEVDKRVETVLREYREKEGTRSSLEAELADAADLPVDALLLYTPARMVQAKGIQTFALERTGILTLGKHSAVEDKVEPLIKDYKKLWRIMLFVHPEYAEEYLKLSKGVDALLRNFAFIHGEKDAFDREYRLLVPRITNACWFSYIPEPNRPAADLLIEVTRAEGEGERPHWRIFLDEAQTELEGTIDAIEHAARAYLLQRLRSGDEYPTGSFDKVKQRYKKHGSLWQDIKKRLEKQENVSSMSDAVKIRRGTQDILNEILSTEVTSRDVGRTR